MQLNEVLTELRDIKNLILTNKQKRYFDMREVVKYTSLSQSTIRRAIQKGELKCSNKTGKLLFKNGDIDRWLNG